MTKSWEGEGKSFIAEPYLTMCYDWVWLLLTRQTSRAAGWFWSQILIGLRLCVVPVQAKTASNVQWEVLVLAVPPITCNLFLLSLSPYRKVGWMVPSLATSSHWWWWSRVFPNDFGNLSALCTSSLVKCTVTIEEDKTWSLGLKEFSSCMQSEK